MPNALGLDDDLDPVEVVRHLERIFDITVSNDEAKRIFKVGEFYDLLLEKIRPNDADRKCATAMTFYRIRSALRRLGYGDGLIPASDTRALERGRTRTNLKNLEKGVGLRMPKAVSTRIGRFASFCAFVVTLAGVFSLQPGPASAFLGILAGMVLAGVALKYFDLGELPANCETLGRLTKVVAAGNCGRLVKMGARHGNEDIWESLMEALSHYALPKSEITRETLFLQSQLKKRASA
jgi:hypothetical protein